MANAATVETEVQCRRCPAQLFVQHTATAAGPGFQNVLCPACGHINGPVHLTGEPTGIRIQGVSHTRAEVEAGAAFLGDARYERWRHCEHPDNKRLLPAVTDSDITFCPRCFALFDRDQLLYEPKAPGARRRIEKCWHEHGAGLPLYLTRHDEGAGPVYRVEDLFGQQVPWHNEAQAKDRAAALLRERGHVCTERCTGWEPMD